MRWKFSSVKPRDRERAAHVGEREDEIDDDRRDEEAGEQHERRPEEQREVGALAADAARAQSLACATSVAEPARQRSRAGRFRWRVSS